MQLLVAAFFTFALFTEIALMLYVQGLCKHLWNAGSSLQETEAYD